MPTRNDDVREWLEEADDDELVRVILFAASFLAKRQESLVRNLAHAAPRNLATDRMYAWNRVWRAADKARRDDFV